MILASAIATARAEVSDAEFAAVKQRLAELEAREDQNWMTQERTQEIRAIVEDVLADANARKQQADGASFGYKDGFYIQTDDDRFKLVIGGYAQFRYEYALQNAYNNRTLGSRTLGAGSSAPRVTPSDPGNASGFDIRRARLNFSGNLLSPDLTFKLEGDFEGGAGGTFGITDAFVAYRFTDNFRIRVGSYKVPFAKAELTPDPFGAFAERAEVLSPFDPIRSLGVSLYGDLLHDKATYEVALNDGSRANTLRQVDTIGGTANLDNRLGAYARVQWAGSGKVSQFSEESDLRPAPDNDQFIWLLGGALGYESQNAANNAFPSPQTTAVTTGLSNADGPGFTNYTLNGDLFRATLDWSAKWHGLSFNTAAYFQQVNANPGNTSTTATASSIGPFGRTDSSFFQHGYYGQIGYFVVPQKLEVLGRIGGLFTEGYPNVGEYYSLGANYFFYGQNMKLQSDITYSPESAFTDPASLQLQNASDLAFRVQFQVKF
ncbi:MAG TPA: porin [Phycisphaerae bacterium]|nr:porin [Phycisphaerae bacterium]